MEKLKKEVVLKNGVSIPTIGYGTWQTPDDECVRAVKTALSFGYRHIDTVAIYRNEPGVGRGIAESGIARSEIFLTSKVWNKCRGYDMVMSAFERTLGKLGTDYLDLYLIHWPASKKHYENPDEVNLDTWRAMTELYKAGHIKAIGVSNFKPHHLKALCESEVAPMVNQIEYHPGYTQNKTVEFCKENGIAIEAWSPLGSGRVLSDKTLAAIGAKYGKSTAQVCIRYCLQNGIIALPKSVTPSRIKENLEVFDFVLSDEDISLINSMGEVGYSGLDPDEVDF